MDYDFRNRAGPPYRQSSAASASPSLYPTVGQPRSNPIPGAPRPSFHTSSPSSSSGIGIRVALKPEYRFTPPPPMLPQVGEVPRSKFHYDFEFERRILAESEKENPNWSRLGLENISPRRTESTSSLGSSPDPVVTKYIASGLSREAVPLAVTNYGDNPEKVREFVNGFTLLREMGFLSNNVPEALLMYDNDTDKALAYLLSSSS